MNVDLAAWAHLEKLTWEHVLLALTVIVAARLLSFALRRSLRHVAESASPRLRLSILRAIPITSLLIGVAALIFIVPIFVEPTFRNAVAVVATVGLALAFALRDCGISARQFLLGYHGGSAVLRVEGGGSMARMQWSRLTVVAVVAVVLTGTFLWGASATLVAPVTTLPAPFDPYKSFRFIVKMDGRAVAGAHVMRGLPAGVAPARRFAKNPGIGTSTPVGQTAREKITMERGVSHDTAFVLWALQSSASAGEIGPAIGLRRDLVVEVRDESGHPAKSYKLVRAWVSAYQALPDLDAGANAVSITHVAIVGERLDPIP